MPTPLVDAVMWIMSLFMKSIEQSNAFIYLRGPKTKSDASAVLIVVVGRDVSCWNQLVAPGRAGGFWNSVFPKAFIYQPFQVNPRRKREDRGCIRRSEDHQKNIRRERLAEGARGEPLVVSRQLGTNRRRNLDLGEDWSAPYTLAWRNSRHVNHISPFGEWRVCLCKL